MPLIDPVTTTGLGLPHGKQGDKQGDKPADTAAQQAFAQANQGAPGPVDVQDKSVFENKPSHEEQLAKAAALNKESDK